MLCWCFLLVSLYDILECDNNFEHRLLNGKFIPVPHKYYHEKHPWNSSSQQGSCQMLHEELPLIGHTMCLNACFSRLQKELCLVLTFAFTNKDMRNYGKSIIAPALYHRYVDECIAKMKKRPTCWTFLTNEILPSEQ